MSQTTTPNAVHLHAGSIDTGARANNTDLIFVRASWRVVVVLIVAVAAVAGAWHAARWFLGDDVARNAFDRDGAEAALRWSPDNPQSHYIRGVIAERRAESFDPVANARAALPFYERATELGTNDYGFWMTLGRAREHAGEGAAAESALRRAVELAPNYALPRWHLGNLLMRAGRSEEAFAELRRAGEADVNFRPQVVNLAWRYFDGDVAQVMGALGDSPAVRAELLNYLVGRKRLDEALQVLKMMDADAEGIKAKAAANLESVLFAAKRFRDATEVNRMRVDLPTSEEADWLTGARVLKPQQIAEFGRIVNPGFEAGVPPAKRDLFGWQLADTQGVKVGLDPTTQREGARSLRVTFAVPGNTDLTTLRQTIAVEPGARYRVTFFMRGADVRSASLPLVEVADARTDGRVLGASAPLAMGTTDWGREVIEFTVPADSDGVTLRLSRQPCGDPVCPIYGRAWYDGFTLEKLGGGARGD